MAVHYRWDWMRASWYRSCAGYFTAERVYSGASLWLTDYVLASALQNSSEESAFTSTRCGACRFGITRELKRAIAGEVARQVQLENAQDQAANQNNSLDATPSVVDGSSHLLLAFTNVYASGAYGQCVLSAGNVLLMAGPSAIQGNAVLMRVLASRSTDCQAGTTVTLPLDQAQEMQNEMRETIDQGLAKLQNCEGQEGIPAGRFDVAAAR
ncbi:MAG: hypothetical protein JO051_17325 [Acidobacteriaceae bacterium]|nr:hypothetical protein [Acidobacteriaceae bacterium]